MVVGNDFHVTTPTSSIVASDVPFGARSVFRRMVAGSRMRGSSLGGAAVHRSLNMVIEEPQVARVALCETAFPRLRGYEAVVVQNALTVIPLHRAFDLMAGTTVKGRARLVAIQSIAYANMRMSSKIVCLTSASATLVAAHVPRLAKRIVTSPVTLPLYFAQEPPRAPRHLHRGEGPYIVIPGAVERYKNLEFGVAVVAHAVSDTSIREVRLVGPCPDRRLCETLLRLARNFGLRLRISSPGEDGFFEQIQRAAAVLLPSRLESLGFILPESLALGCRVAASDIPAHMEVAARLGQKPEWFNPFDLQLAVTALTRSIRSKPSEARVDLQRIQNEWQAFACSLGIVAT